MGMKLHCIYCGERSPNITLPLDEHARSLMRGFILYHDMRCGPKSAGGIFESDDPAEIEALKEELRTIPEEPQ